MFGSGCSSDLALDTTTLELLMKKWIILWKLEIKNWKLLSLEESGYW